jgi:hypothetical protein
MSEAVTQDEVDAVAHFVQAAKDLRASPIFTEEQCEISVAYNERGITYKVPDPRVRDAMAIPFRRIWQPGEPGRFERICNILRRRDLEWRSLIDFCKESCQHARKQFDDPGEDGLGVTPEDVINMWLHCRLTHVGATTTKGKFSRSDFDRESTRLGEAKFEYLFLNACHRVGLCYINLLQVAEKFLSNQWASQGLKPTFVFEDDLAAHGTRACKDGVWLERSTPGMTIAPDDLPARLSLLRRRRAFLGMDKLIRILSIDASYCIQLLQTSSAVGDFLELAGFAAETVDHVSVVDGASSVYSVSDDFADVQRYPWRKGSIARFGSEIRFAGQAREIVEEQFVRLKEVLFGGVGGEPGEKEGAS